MTGPEGAESPTVGRLTLPLHMPLDTFDAGEHVQARRELAEAIGDRDHIVAYYRALSVLATRRLHPLREISGGRGLRNIRYVNLPEATKMASPLDPRFPEYIGRKLADSIPTEVRNLAATRPDSPIAELVRGRDMLAVSMHLVRDQRKGQLPKGTEAAQIAAGLAGTFIREPAVNERGERSFVIYTPQGLVYGDTEKDFEGNLRRAAYTTTPSDVSPFVPEAELGIYGGQPNFLYDELRTAREQTTAQLVGPLATKHLT